jgi:hypothetical protein
MTRSLKFTNSIKLEVNGKLVNEKVQEILVYKDERGKEVKKVRNTITRYCPIDENGVPIDNDFF